MYCLLCLYWPPEYDEGLSMYIKESEVFLVCHVWVHWRLRVNNVFHYSGTAAGDIDSEEQFCWVSAHEEEVMQPPRRRRGQDEKQQIDRYILASCYLDFCRYSFVLNIGLGNSWRGHPPFPPAGVWALVEILMLIICRIERSMGKNEEKAPPTTASGTHPSNVQFKLL